MSEKVDTDGCGDAQRLVEFDRTLAVFEFREKATTDASKIRQRLLRQALVNPCGANKPAQSLRRTDHGSRVPRALRGGDAGRGS